MPALRKASWPSGTACSANYNLNPIVANLAMPTWSQLWMTFCLQPGRPSRTEPPNHVRHLLSFFFASVQQTGGPLGVFPPAFLVFLSGFFFPPNHEEPNSSSPKLDPPQDLKPPQGQSASSVQAMFLRIPLLHTSFFFIFWVRSKFPHSLSVSTVVRVGAI